jgi:branched-chain amino acid transport system substrate-binding protein
VKAYGENINGELPPYTGLTSTRALQLIAAALNKANSTDINAVRDGAVGPQGGYGAWRRGNARWRPSGGAADGHQPDLCRGPTASRPTTSRRIEPGPDIIPPVDPACKK